MNYHFLVALLDISSISTISSYTKSYAIALQPNVMISPNVVRHVMA